MIGDKLIHFLVVRVSYKRMKRNVQIAYLVYKRKISA